MLRVYFQWSSWKNIALPWLIWRCNIKNREKNKTVVMVLEWTTEHIAFLQTQQTSVEVTG